MANSIGDSDSIKINKILVPHSNAISILTMLLINHDLDEFKWLDLACGQGQILLQLGDNLDSTFRNKISLSLVDINNGALREAVTVAEDLDLKSINEDVNDICEFCLKKIEPEKFHFISFVNSLHEIKPKEIAFIFVKSIIGLQPDGILYLFDQESLPYNDLELGAITWTSFEIVQIFNDFFEKCSINYNLSPNKWNHTENSSWSLQILRKKIEIENKKLDKSIPIMESIIKNILSSKLETIKKALQSSTKTGKSTDIEEHYQISNLYDFWSLSRAMEDYS